MTRGKWVALVVGLAVIAVLVLASPRLLYQTEMRALVFHSGFEMYEFGEVLQAPPEGDCFVEIRRVWFSRPRSAFEPQGRARCGWCLRSRHDSCPRKVSGGGSIGSSRIVPFPVYECDCPHPSHAQESE